ncbi:DUF6538 domain-containing protein [Rhodobacter capsulatus]|uniref:DUF6538 domain-containing protein n=1 Tax=Rhodobacter capsulatus TaxID=1061 RepID=UPI003B8A8BE1
MSFSLRTRSAAVAKRQAYEIAAKLDRHWHDLRMSDDNLLSRYQRKITPSSDTITQSVGIDPSEQSAPSLLPTLLKRCRNSRLP